MDRNIILIKLNAVFKDVFDDEELKITEATKPEDIEDWDSIGHVYLTVGIEDEFGIILGEEMNQAENVKDIISLILSKVQ